MSRTALSILSFMTAATVTLGCGGGTATPGGSTTAGMAGVAGPGSAGAGGGGGTMPPGPMGGGGSAGKKMKPGMMGTGGTAVIIGVPTPGTPGTIFPGGGPTGMAPLAPGCTPASANECPTMSGVCATSATSAPTGTTGGSICFFGPITTTTTTTASTRAATIEYIHETAGGQEYYRFRITFDPAFVDNTYGVNAIGWVTRGHTFKDLVGSDHAELSLFDGTLALVSKFDIDYITASATAACAYDALGVSGGEGGMLVGDAKYILASTTSLDRNLNGCGYCKSSACGGDCTIDSPATDAKYTPNPAAPNWDYRVIYEVWVDAAAFTGKGFGGASISFVHASPSKASTNTVTVTPKPCGGCPEGTPRVETPLGSKCCPPGTTEGPTCSCPAGTTKMETPLGSTCCPEGSVPVEGSEGTTCAPGCPPGTRRIETSLGSTCTTCPEGTSPVEGPTGTTCEPVVP